MSRRLFMQQSGKQAPSRSSAGIVRAPNRPASSPAWAGMFGSVGPASPKLALMTLPLPVTWTMEPDLPVPGSRSVQKKQM